uniref:Uncharacterized protein n=2 Tax=Caenorhabditis japonica TaxID=281687 RepID=A0A8R1ISC8_CAEJA
MCLAWAPLHALLLVAPTSQRGTVHHITAASWYQCFNNGDFERFNLGALKALIREIPANLVDDITQDIIYLTARTYLPIIYPLSLIICHENLRADYTTNFFLCRKARNLHKESKVKVIATRESQESIIANLKMIGILSEVDPNQPGAAAAAGMMGISGVVGSGEGGGRANSSRTSIAKDPTSSASMGSLPGGTMLFHTRPKQPVPSVGLVG